MFNSRYRRVTLPLAPAIGGGFGLAIAVLIAVLPTAWLESLALASGLPAILAAAAPPLGATARVILLLIAGGGVALLTSVGLWLVLGDRTIALGSRAETPALPMVRRADSHPDAPPRPPVRAHRDLGAPMMSLAPADLPDDLDRPLAEFDPDAIPPVPRAPSRPVAPLVRFERPQLIDPGDRFSTFDPAPEAAEIEPAATLNALLDRLERGIARQPKPGRSLDEALVELRRLAS